MRHGLVMARGRLARCLLVAMKSLGVVILAAAASASGCGEHAPSPASPQILALERWSPPQHTSYDVFLAAGAAVIVMSRRFSRDAGATWTNLDPRLGELGRVAI